MFADKEWFKAAFVERLQMLYGKSLEEASVHDKYIALGTLIRDHDWPALGEYQPAVW